jgi:hypothetical protein
MTSSSHVLVVSMEPFIKLIYPNERISRFKTDEDDGQLKQPMFQLADTKSVPITPPHLDFPAISHGRESGRASRLSMFSYSSEILEKRGEMAAREAERSRPPFRPSETNQDTAAN